MAHPGREQAASSWMQASAVRKSTEPCEYTLPSQPSTEPLL